MWYIKAYRVVYKGQNGLYMRGTVKFTGQTVKLKFDILTEKSNLCMPDTTQNYIVTTKQLANVSGMKPQSHSLNVIMHL